jgi:hypothetical protein
MNSFFNHLIRRPTFISVITALYFAYLIFHAVYGWFNPPKIGSGYNMVLETLLIFSIVPLGLFIIDRLLVFKINNLKLAIIEAFIFGGFFLYLY